MIGGALTIATGGLAAVPILIAGKYITYYLFTCWCLLFSCLFENLFGLYPCEMHQILYNLLFWIRHPITYLGALSKRDCYIGTSVGIAAAVTGGSAAISEKVIKSRQMKAAKAALEADQKVTGQIEEKLQSLALNKNFAKSVAKDVAKSGGNLTISSLTLNSLLIKTATSGGFLTKGKI